MSEDILKEVNRFAFTSPNNKAGIFNSFPTQQEIILKTISLTRADTIKKVKEIMNKIEEETGINYGCFNRLKQEISNQSPHQPELENPLNLKTVGKGVDTSNKKRATQK